MTKKKTPAKKPSTPNTFFQNRWGKEAEELGFTMVPNAFLDKIHAFGLTGSQTMTLIIILRHWYPDKNPRVFKKKIADSLGITQSTVGRNLKFLEDNNFLERRLRKKNGNADWNDSTEFDLDSLVKMVRKHSSVLCKAKKEAEKIKVDSLKKKKGA